MKESIKREPKISHTHLSSFFVFLRGYLNPHDGFGSKCVFPPSPSKSALHSRGVFACGVRATYDTDVGRVFPKHTSSLAFTFPSTEQEQSPRPPSLSDMGGRAPRSPPPRSPLPRSPPPPRARMHNPGEQSCGVGLLIKDVKDKKTGFLSFSI
jgi:hypothetical protein